MFSQANQCPARLPSASICVHLRFLFPIWNKNEYYQYHQSRNSLPLFDLQKVMTPRGVALPEVLLEVFETNQK